MMMMTYVNTYFISTECKIRMTFLYTLDLGLYTVSQKNGTK